ncbi:MAG: neutral/alkaline non-lysosomal ceramidase N-terminal domain-containing protein [Opitutaceae bacterium]
MRIGLAHVDITPRVGGELCGFASRVQPGVGVLDPLQAKALYLTDGSRRLLWIHCDLIGFDPSIIAAFRRWAFTEFGLEPAELMLSATHTHSGPGTLQLDEAGRFDPDYIEFLLDKLHVVARDALARMEECDLVTAHGQLELAVDRRKQPSSHTDPCVVGAGFRRSDGTFAAVILNYAIHPVALGSVNRAVSSDIMGRAADALANQLPGHPMVFATNGACGNLNPPATDVPLHQVVSWGCQIAAAITPRLLAAKAQKQATFSTVARSCLLPLEVVAPAELAAYANAAIARGPSSTAWRIKYRGVIERWRDALLADWKNGPVPHQREVELFAIDLGGLVFLGINAEVFSRFTEWIRGTTGRRVCIVAYANGNLGYLCTREAYAEGGYEVDDAHFFYGGYRFQAGALEILAESAADLLRALPPPSEFPAP